MFDDLYYDDDIDKVKKVKHFLNDENKKFKKKVNGVIFKW